MSDLNKLKIKRLTLAAESRLIKREEQKSIRWARAINVALNPEGGEAERFSNLINKHGYTPAQAVRILTRAQKAGARTWEANARERYLDLRKHRIGVVRWHARVQHLAHAFIKGMPYAKVEAKAHDIGPAAWFGLRLAVAKEVETFGGPELKNVTQKLRLHMVDAWFEGRSYLLETETVAETISA